MFPTMDPDTASRCKDQSFPVGIPIAQPIEWSFADVASTSPPVRRWVWSRPWSRRRLQQLVVEPKLHLQGNCRINATISEEPCLEKKRINQLNLSSIHFLLLMGDEGEDLFISFILSFVLHSLVSFLFCFLSFFLSVLCSFLVFVYPVLSVISVLCSWLGRPENAHSFGRTSLRHSVFLCIVYHVHWCFAGLDMYHLDKDNAWLREVKSQMASVGVLNRC